MRREREAREERSGTGHLKGGKSKGGKKDSKKKKKKKQKSRDRKESIGSDDGSDVDEVNEDGKPTERDVVVLRPDKPVKAGSPVS